MYNLRCREGEPLQAGAPGRGVTAGDIRQPLRRSIPRRSRVTSRGVTLILMFSAVLGCFWAAALCAAAVRAQRRVAVPVSVAGRDEAMWRAGDVAHRLHCIR